MRSSLPLYSYQEYTAASDSQYLVSMCQRCIFYRYYGLDPPIGYIQLIKLRHSEH